MGLFEGVFVFFLVLADVAELLLGNGAVVNREVLCVVMVFIRLYFGVWFWGSRFSFIYKEG